MSLMSPPPKPPVSKATSRSGTLAAKTPMTRSSQVTSAAGNTAPGRMLGVTNPMTSVSAPSTAVATTSPLGISRVSWSMKATVVMSAHRANPKTAASAGPQTHRQSSAQTAPSSSTAV